MKSKRTGRMRTRDACSAGMANRQKKKRNINLANGVKTAGF